MGRNYDFHIHSCLSPCADDDMTPCNIVQMAMLAELDVIALTDHNSALNTSSIIKASKQFEGALVIAGMELETEEGIHIVLLFEDAETALKASQEVRELLPDIANDPLFYGNQLVLDGEDNEVCREQRLLLLPSAIPLYGVKTFADKFGAVAFPAHIDRPEGGILAVMGGIDDDMGFAAVELSPLAPPELEKEYADRGYKIIKGSDAHQLGKIGENQAQLSLKELSVKAVLDFLREKQKG